MSTTKVKGLHLSLDLIKFLGKFAKEIRFPESRVVEALLSHLKELPDSERKDLISKFLTKNL